MVEPIITIIPDPQHEIFQVGNSEFLVAPPKKTGKDSVQYCIIFSQEMENGLLENFEGLDHLRMYGAILGA